MTLRRRDVLLGALGTGLALALPARALATRLRGIYAHIPLVVGVDLDVLAARDPESVPGLMRRSLVNGRLASALNGPQGQAWFADAQQRAYHLARSIR